MWTNQHLRPYSSVLDQLGYLVKAPYFSVTDEVLQDFRSFVIKKQMPWGELEEKEKEKVGKPLCCFWAPASVNSIVVQGTKSTKKEEKKGRKREERKEKSSLKGADCCSLHPAACAKGQYWPSDTEQGLRSNVIYCETLKDVRESRRGPLPASQEKAHKDVREIVLIHACLAAKSCELGWDDGERRMKAGRWVRGFSIWGGMWWVGVGLGGEGRVVCGVCVGGGCLGGADKRKAKAWEGSEGEKRGETGGLRDVSGWQWRPLKLCRSLGTSEPCSAPSSPPHTRRHTHTHTPTPTWGKPPGVSATCFPWALTRGPLTLLGGDVVRPRFADSLAKTK